MGKKTTALEVPFEFFLQEVSKFESVSQSSFNRPVLVPAGVSFFRNYGAIILNRSKEYAGDLDFERLRKVYEFFKGKDYEPLAGKVWFYDEQGNAKPRGFLNPNVPIFIYNIQVGKFEMILNYSPFEMEVKRGALWDRVSIGFVEDHHNSP